MNCQLHVVLQAGGPNCSYVGDSSCQVHFQTERAGGSEDALSLDVMRTCFDTASNYSGDFDRTTVLAEALSDASRLSPFVEKISALNFSKLQHLLDSFQSEFGILDRLARRLQVRCTIVLGLH